MLVTIASSRAARRYVTWQHLALTLYHQHLSPAESRSHWPPSEHDAVGWYTVSISKLHSLTPSRNDRHDSQHRQSGLDAERRLTECGGPVVLQAIGQVEGGPGMFAGVGVRSSRELHCDEGFEHPLRIRGAWFRSVERRVLSAVVHGLGNRYQRLPAYVTYCLELLFGLRVPQTEAELVSLAVDLGPSRRLCEYLRLGIGVSGCENGRPDTSATGTNSHPSRRNSEL